MERVVTVPGGRLFVVDEGAGPPIVLLHAIIVDLRAWDPLVPGLVAAGFRVVRYDARGYGRSETTAVEFSPRADLMAVLETAGVRRAAFVGNSHGGAVALDAAIEFPDRVQAVIAVGAGLNGYEPDLPPHEMALFVEEARLSRADPPDPDAIADFDVRLWVDGPGQSPDRVDPGIREAVRRMDRPLYVPGRVFGRAVELDPPAAQRLSDLRCPVLAVAGALDVSDVAETAQYLEAHAPDARAVILPDVAHMIGLEAPDRLVGLIAEFLRPLQPWD